MPPSPPRIPPTPHTPHTAAHVPTTAAPSKSYGMTSSHTHPFAKAAVGPCLVPHCSHLRMRRRDTATAQTASTSNWTHHVPVHRLGQQGRCKQCYALLATPQPRRPACLIGLIMRTDTRGTAVVSLGLPLLRLTPLHAVVCIGCEKATRKQCSSRGHNTAAAAVAQ